MRKVICLIILSVVFYDLPLFAADTLTLTVLNWNGSSPSGELSFPYELATIGNPWVRSSQYLKVTYSSDVELWGMGIRIVTDNNLNRGGGIYPKPINIGPDRNPGVPGVQNEWEWQNHSDWNNKYKYENGTWLTGDDSVSFGGLIDSATKNNPNFRAELAWQVFVDPVPEPDAIYKDPLGNWNVVGDWNSDWAYIVDKSDKWNGVISIGGIYLPPPAPLWSPRYEMVVTGDPYTSYLAQHPVVSGSRDNPDPKYGDCDIAIYLAACFGVKQDGEFTSILPAGNYGTAIYLELLHE